MARKLVFKTEGKLDLRSITTFGLNSKPKADGHPIGYFGTGLKYAIAVLTRKNIPITLMIDGQRWTIDTEVSKFRDKEVTEIFLVRHKKLLPPSRIKLPFTTMLGKDWELWQAFRELQSNTIDEQGETFIANEFSTKKNSTLIFVESEDFITEYFDRDKTFLPEGLMQRNNSDTVQVFDRPSKYIYYRGIRIVDLKPEEESNLTYNILQQIQLTEDRTARSLYDVQWTLQNFVASSENPEFIKKVLIASKSGLESKFYYGYALKSRTFLETAHHYRGVSSSVREASEEYTKQLRKEELSKDHWQQILINAIQAGDNDKIIEIIDMKRDEVVVVLENDLNQCIAASTSLEEPTNEQSIVEHALGTDEPNIQEQKDEHETDDIPF